MMGQAHRLLDADSVATPAFELPDQWVWCGSVIRDDAGLYHMFASCWPKALSFHPHWLTNSQIVRATSRTPEGPYRFVEVVLPPRGAEYWDGRMTHNPTIHRAGDTYLLYYTGSTYADPPPTPGRPAIDYSPLVNAAHANQRIGLATAPSPAGPWTRRDRPIIEPRPGRWDGLMVTNPAPCVRPDGRALLIYKSVARRGERLQLGAAIADHYDGPYRRLSDEPIVHLDDPMAHVEDPYVWWDGRRYQMVMKDMTGAIGGEERGGVGAWSDDGVHWQLHDPPTTYSRRLRLADGSERWVDSLERPQLLIEHGRPTYLFAATAELDGVGNDGTYRAHRSWNMAIRLGPGEG